MPRINSEHWTQQGSAGNTPDRHLMLQTWMVGWLTGFTVGRHNNICQDSRWRTADDLQQLHRYPQMLQLAHTSHKTLLTVGWQEICNVIDQGRKTFITTHHIRRYSDQKYWMTIKHWFEISARFAKKKDQTKWADSKSYLPRMWFTAGSTAKASIKVLTR